MRKIIITCIASMLLACSLSGPSRADEPITIGDVYGGLVVQLGAAETSISLGLGRTGRYVVHLLDSEPGMVTKARAALKAAGIYGLVSAETLAEPARLPYS